MHFLDETLFMGEFFIFIHIFIAIAITVFVVFFHEFLWHF